MKSAYCIAITACLTVIWLYEEKKKRGMAGKLCWKAAAGYLITRFVFFAISNQEVHGFLEVMAMDLVTAGLLYILSGKNGSRESVWECLYLYIWNPIPVLSVLSQGKKRMLFIWLAVLILFVGSSWIEHFRARLGIERFKKIGILLTVAGTGILWARDITGERFGQCSPGDEFYPLMLMFFAVLGVGTCVYGIASYVGIIHEKCQIPESKVELDEAKAARCVSKRMTGSEKIDAGKSLGIKSCEKNTEPEKTGAPWSGRDGCMAAGLTVLFAVMAFVNLGSMKAPQTAYEFEKNDSHGNEMVLRFDGSVTISEAQVYLGGKEKRHFVCSVPNAEGDGWDAIGEETELLSVYCWNPVEIHYRTYELGIVSMDESAEVLEIVLLDPDGNPILPSNADDYPEAFDEQELFPADTTYEYQSMFDEVYHARTANEIVEGRTIYETTHPPLGKWWMSLGIRVFGMTPFGWRCVCALFGILMVPVSYAFMRKISRSTWIASFAALLIVFDFMHFTLSRIGTIDVIVGFFILLTFYLMYLVLDDLKMGCSWKTVCLMILNGMAAGAAMASKWTGVYACAGIAVLFFTFLFQEYGTAAARTRKGMSGQAAISYLVGLSVICIAAYLLIPAVIYVASYLSYGNGMGNGNIFQTMWENQQHMLHYHEKTVFEHPYASEWYEWAWIKRPLLDAYTSLKSGKISVVSTFGNPVIWWSAIPALFYNIYLWQIRQDKIARYLCISYASMLFPWLFIHRTVFIYQYFACSMIQILMLGNCLRFFWERDPKRTRKATLLYLAAVIGAFLLFYPVLSGYPVKQEFAEQWLEWLEGWVLS